jgi:hypothetical protein
MKRKRLNLKYKKERALLSDVLPYELPLTFSNRYLYHFYRKNNIEYHEGKVRWKKSDPALDAIVRLICGAGPSAQIQTAQVTTPHGTIQQNTLVMKNSQSTTIPFGFKIRHKENEFRELTVCHPRNQLQLVNLYDQYKELILACCSVSPFSIRRPTRISKSTFFMDSLHYGALSKETVGIEQTDKEYENLRSFFVYKDYSHIFRFYESDKFHRCEKKYNKLLRLDISKCFDSIYTHSLPWALYGKEPVKEALTSNPSRLEKTFGDRFDKLMQLMNYRETNGIIIGPEFSRVFAELILQSVDRSVCAELHANEKYQYLHKVDYEMFRYVDDYFIFYNEEKICTDIMELLQLRLKDFKLSLNKSKAEAYSKPIITNISRAKHRIAKLLDSTLTFKFSDVGPAATGAPAGGHPQAAKRGTIHINSNSLTIDFKTIIKESNVDYKDTLNYTLAIIEDKSQEIIKDYLLISGQPGSEEDLCRAFLAICDFMFFIYSVSPRVHTTIKLCRILYIFSSFLKRKEVNPDSRHSVFKLIFDNIRLILIKNAGSEHTPVETLYLLIALADLGKDYWLAIELLCKYFNAKVDPQSGQVQIKMGLSYISIVVLLFYMKDKREYQPLRAALEEAIKEKFKKRKATLSKETELLLLLFDCLTCPYVNLATKEELLDLYGIQDPALRMEIIQRQKYWFTKWTGFDFGKELDAKQSREVY